MKKVKEGERFGRLTIMALGHRAGTVYRDQVKCDCGTIKTVCRSDIQSGRVLSCGCLRKEQAKQRGLATRQHGHSQTPLYHLWHTMIARCHNPNHAAYRYYGGRGIQVCDRWRRSFEAFMADMGPRPVGLELDRIDSDGHYEPGNVLWLNNRMNKLTRVQRSSHYTPRTAEWNGQVYPISMIAEMAGVSYRAFYSKLILKGMSVDNAIQQARQVNNS